MGFPKGFFMGYTYALDLSLACTGVSIFDNDGNPVLTFSVETEQEMPQSKRIEKIVNTVLLYTKKYHVECVVIERGFTKFNNSTQALFRLQGAIMYVFCDIDQVFYAPTTIKKMVSGDGRAKKDAVEASIKKDFPQIIFSNQDESDSFAVGLTHFKTKGIL